jgi:hypothetical protein
VGSEVQILPGPPDGFCWARLVERVEVECGGVAQLGEHLLCKQGVIGSNPFTSIDRFYDQYLFHIVRLRKVALESSEVSGVYARHREVKNIGVLFASPAGRWIERCVCLGSVAALGVCSLLW